MSKIVLNSGLFFKRCSKIYKKLNKPLLVIRGKSADVLEFRLNSALFIYLLNYEFSDSALIIKEEPVVITSYQKAPMLSQIQGLKVVLKQRDNSNMDSILGILTESYGVVDSENLKGDFSKILLSNIKHSDVTKEAIDIFLTKDDEEINILRQSGIVSNYMLQKGIELVRECNFSKDTLENHMNDKINGILNSKIDFVFDPEHSSNHVRIGIRYKEYTTEIARKIMCDSNVEYDIQNYALKIIEEGKNSGDVLDNIIEYASDKGYEGKIKMYSVGMLTDEPGFENGFTLNKNTVFVLNLNNEFCNTFYIDKTAKFLTKRDTSEDYTEAKLRFRNKGNEALALVRIKEHQRELFDKLIDEQLEFYRNNVEKGGTEEKKASGISKYDKNKHVPRSKTMSFDWNNMYVLIPILDYCVPFHISTIKNAAVATVNNSFKIRINFKENKELQGEEVFDTSLKCITFENQNSESLLAEINEMKKEFNKPKIFIGEECGKLKEIFKKYALMGVYMRSDVKGPVRKMINNLELHENGFKYGETVILFSNVKNLFYIYGDFENKAILHFHFKKPIAINDKPTYNLQFFRKFGISYLDTNKKTDERNERIMEDEELAEINRINEAFDSFVQRIEETKALKVEYPERGFVGVHSKETVHFMITNDCVVSLTDSPFFVLNFDEVEIVNLERITFITKTFDCVFIFKNKKKPVMPINSIDTTRLLFLKDLLDSRNIVFMETKVSINWNNLMASIMENPVGFYENGGWADLIREEEDESTAASSEDSESEEESSIQTTSSTGSDDSDKISDEGDSCDMEDETEEDDSYDEDSVDLVKKRKKI